MKIPVHFVLGRAAPQTTNVLPTLVKLILAPLVPHLQDNTVMGPYVLLMLNV